MTFKTERLFLKPVLESDAEFIMELFNTPDWIKHIGDRNIKTKKDARNYIKAKMLPQLKRLGYGNYTVIRKSDNCKLGTCGLYDRDGLDGVDIGFAFLPRYHNKGYAYEASSCLINAAFEDFKLKSVKAITTKENFSSQNLIMKLGLKLKGTIELPYDKEELMLFEINKKPVFK